MVNSVLIAYVSHSGSTREIAEFVGRALEAQGRQVDVRPASEVSDLAPYDAVVAGGLLYRFGWHSGVVRFLGRHLSALQERPVALFVTAMRVVPSPWSEQGSPPVFIDPAMGRATQGSSQTGMLVRMAMLERCLSKAMPLIESIRPVSLGCFAGKYDPDTLDTPNRLAMAVVTRISGARPGDYRNWDAIETWAQGLDLGEVPAPVV